MWNRSSKRECIVARPCWQRFASWWPLVFGGNKGARRRPVAIGSVDLVMRRPRPASDVRNKDLSRDCCVALSGERIRRMSKILLVEDNEMSRDMLSRRLERRGYQVIIAVDGQAGVALAQSHAPD